MALAVATNNSIVLKKKQENLFDASKRLKSATPEAVEVKLTPSQRRSLAFNKAVLTLQTSKVC